MKWVLEVMEDALFLARGLYTTKDDIDNLADIHAVLFCLEYDPD